MKEKISFGSVVFYAILWFLVFCFFYFGGVEAAPKSQDALLFPTPKSHAKEALSVPEVYRTNTLPVVHVPRNAKIIRKDYTLHNGRRVSGLFKYYTIYQKKTVLYQVVGNVAVDSEDDNTVFWQQWSEGGPPLAALLRQDGSGYTVARDAFVSPYHSMPDSQGKIFIQAKLVSESIPDEDVFYKKMGDTGVFAIEDFDFKVELP